MKYRVAIVGAGGIARRHARACQEVADAELVAVCDVRPEAAEKLGDEFGVARRAVGLEALLAGERLDVAVVATWGDSHAEVARALASSGRVRAILCEKPISLNAAQTEAMQAEARAHGVLLAEAFKFRYHPAHLKARELVEAGALGRVSHVRSTFTTAAPPRLRDPDVNWRFNPSRGGGAIYDLGCYCTHHARWTMGDDPSSVFAHGRWGDQSGVDETVAATLVFPGDRTAQWWISFGDVPSQEVELFGSGGRLRIDRAWNNEDQPTTVELWDGAGERSTLAFEPTFQFALQLQHLCDCLRTGQPHRIPPEDSLGQMRTLDALYASLRAGQPVAVARSAATIH
jgi:xylose dehydrogenase (NAD/NADP)